jgi:hypothetical protein
MTDWTIDHLLNLGPESTKSLLIELNYICKVRHQYLSSVLAQARALPQLSKEDYSISFLRFHHEICTSILAVSNNAPDTDLTEDNHQQPFPAYPRFLALQSLYDSLFPQYAQHADLVNTLLITSIEEHYDMLFAHTPLTRCQFLGLSDVFRQHPHITAALAVDMPPQIETDPTAPCRVRNDPNTPLVYGEFTLSAIAQTFWSKAVTIHNLLHNVHYQCYANNSPIPRQRPVKVDVDNDDDDDDDEDDDDDDDDDDDNSSCSDSNESESNDGNNREDSDDNASPPILPTLQLPHYANLIPPPPLPQHINFEQGNDLYIERADTVWLSPQPEPQPEPSSESPSTTASTATSPPSGPTFPQDMVFANANIRRYLDPHTNLNHHHPTYSINHPPQPSHIFTDLGGGTGKLAIYSSFLTNAFTANCSIEVVPTFHNLACEFAQPIEMYRGKDRDMEKLHQSTIHILNGSFFDLDWTYSDLVITTSTCFTSAMFAQLAYRARLLKPGSVFVTLAEPLMHPCVEMLYSIELPMTWGPAEAFFHIRK